MHSRHSISRSFSTLLHSNSTSSSTTTTSSQIRTLVKQGHYLSALKLYTQSPNSQIPNKFTFPSLLKASAALSNQKHGKSLHSTIITMGLHFDPFIATSLINMYVKCGSFDDAVQVFDEMSERGDVTLWNSMIDGYFKYGFFRDGVGQIWKMKLMGVEPDAYTICIVLGAFSKLGCIVEGKKVHGYIVRNFLECDAFLDSALIDMYMKCGRPMDGWRVFDKLEDKSNVVVRNVVIGGFCENGMWEKSFEFYVQSKANCNLGSAMFSSVLTACSYTSSLQFGMEVHCDILKFGFEWEPYVCTSLVTMYGRFMQVEDAKEVFDSIEDKGIELWNAIISTHIVNDFVAEAFEHYGDMRLSGLQSDSFTVTNVLSGCSTTEYYGFGRRVHGEIIKRPVQNSTSVQSALLTMYARCGYIEDANFVFSTIQERDTVAWGSMISGLFRNKRYVDGLKLFKDMTNEGMPSDSAILASLVGASAALEYVELGTTVHGLAIKNGTSLDLFVSCTLIDMYAKCGPPDLAELVFSEMPHRNIVAWNSISCCYSLNGFPELCIGILPQIISQGLIPDPVCITNTLVAISSLTTLLKGKSIHSYYKRHYIQSDVQVENAMIDMYIKCGCSKYALRIFENMDFRTTVTWNSLIAGFGSHGDCLKAVELFKEMQEEGESPDDVTFLALVSACSHCGWISEGLRLFQSMKEDYGIEPRMEHYANMVDLWGRAGYLTEAYRFIQSMPIKPDKSVWLCLLFACRTHRNIALGELAGDQLMQMEPGRGSNCVQLLTLYGEGELWDKAVDMRMSMKHRGLKKNPGCSWIEMKDKVSVFLSGDSSSPWTLDIYESLESLRNNMEEDDDWCDLIIL